MIKIGLINVCRVLSFSFTAQYTYCLITDKPTIISIILLCSVAYVGWGRSFDE